MTIFLCVLSVLALFGVGDVRLKGSASARLVFGLQALSVTLTLGLATLALWSYLS